MQHAVAANQIFETSKTEPHLITLADFFGPLPAGGRIVVGIEDSGNQKSPPKIRLATTSNVIRLKSLQLSSKNSGGGSRYLCNKEGKRRKTNLRIYCEYQLQEEDLKYNHLILSDIGNSGVPIRSYRLSKAEKSLRWGYVYTFLWVTD